MASGLNDDDDLEENHEINVTPFIDVILVLLIIFMVAAPLSTVDIPVDLPVASAKAPSRPDKPLFVTIRKDLTLAVGDVDVARTSLTVELDRIVAGKKDERVFLRADKTVPYGSLIEVMNLLRGGGFLKVALVGLDSGEPPMPLPLRQP